MIIHKEVVTTNQQQHITNAIAIMLVFIFIYPSWFLWAVPLGAVLPDLDIIVQTAFKVGVHRKLLHNIFLPIFILIIGYASATHRFTIFLAIGVTVHLLADSITKGRMYYLWPVSNAHTGGGISFSRPKGGKTIIKKVNNEIKSMVSQWAFIGFTALEVAVLYLARGSLRELMEMIML